MEMQEFKSGRETLKAALMDDAVLWAMAEERGLPVYFESGQGRPPTRRKGDFVEVPGIDEPVRIYQDRWYVERANGNIESMSAEDFEAMARPSPKAEASAKLSRKLRSSRMPGKSQRGRGGGQKRPTTPSGKRKQWTPPRGKTTPADRPRKDA